jgi:hypothetical protein
VTLEPGLVLAEFEFWMDSWPDCAAKRWVEENPPTAADARDATARVLSHA